MFLLDLLVCVAGGLSANKLDRGALNYQNIRGKQSNARN